MFTDGSFFDEVIETPQGQIRVFAETHIFGSHLVLDGILFYPHSQSAPIPIGVNQVLAIRQAVHTWAREAGFSELTMSFHRTGAKRTGAIMTHTRSLL